MCALAGAKKKLDNVREFEKSLSVSVFGGFWTLSAYFMCINSPN